MELIIGIGVLIGGAFIFIVALSFPRMAGAEYPGPGFFPELLGILLSICGIIITIFNIIKKAWPHVPEMKDKWGEVIKITAVIISVTFYIYIVDFLGFILTVVLILVGLMVILGVPVQKSIPIGIGLSGATYLLFNKLLAVPLPEGFFIR